MTLRIPLAALAVAALLATIPLQSVELQKQPKPDTTAVDTTAVTVYITRTGKKYHRAGCASLRQSSIPTTLEEAKRSYGACSKCNPPE